MTYLENQGIEQLTRRIEDIESELFQIRQSFTYKIGCLIRKSFYKPRINLLKLPIALFLLVIEHHKDKKKSNIDKSNSFIKNEYQIIHPGQEAYKMSYYSKFNPLKKQQSSGLIIATIASKKINYCLSFDVIVVELEKGNWEQKIIENNIDFLLVQTDIGRHEIWSPSKLSNNSSFSLPSICNYCKNQNIPTVLWDTEEYLHYPLISSYAINFDKIFVADPISKENYDNDLNIEAIRLNLAIQPTLHNPLRNEGQSFERYSLLFDGWADIVEYPISYKFLKKIAVFGLNIVESRYLLNSNKLNDTPDFIQNILGCTSYEQLLSVYRYYKAIIIHKNTLSSLSTLASQALEAVCCGCYIVYIGDFNRLIPPELYISTINEGEAQKRLDYILNNEEIRQRETHRIRRKLYGEHTYSHRLNTICESIGIPYKHEEKPKVSIITPTKRPENLKKCISNYMRQSYANKELIIIVNTDNVKPEIVNEMICKYPNIRHYILHQENNIGICLNHGIENSTGEIWFKMDDDDYYGANYITDFIHLKKAADFNFFGKPTAYIYLEKDNQIYLFRNAIKSQHVIGSSKVPHLCGATIGGFTNEPLRFSSFRRSSVDTEFKKEAKRNNYTIITGDIWNFIAYRSSDKAEHTWQEDDQYLKIHAGKSNYIKFIHQLINK